MPNVQQEGVLERYPNTLPTESSSFGYCGKRQTHKRKGGGNVLMQFKYLIFHIQLVKDSLTLIFYLAETLGYILIFIKTSLEIIWSYQTPKQNGLNLSVRNTQHNKPKDLFVCKRLNARVTAHQHDHDSNPDQSGSTNFNIE